MGVVSDGMSGMQTGIVCGLAVAAAFAAGMACGDRHGQTIDVKTLTVYDTMRVVCPVARDSVVVRRVAVRVPVLDKTGDKLSVAADSVSLSEADSVSVALDIESRRYDGENYTAWVSGHMPRLDSIRVFRERIIAPRPVGKHSDRWVVSVGLGLTAGPRGVEPGAFVGVGYRIAGF